MYFVVFATDHPGNSALRARTKARHSEHLDAAADGVRVLQTGPWLDADGNEAGSLLVLEADSLPLVDAFMKADPYAQAGLFSRVEIHPWLWRRGNPYLASGASRVAGNPTST